MVSGALAIAGDRLVAIVNVERAGSITVYDFANGNIHEVTAEELKAPLAATSRKAFDACAVCAATEAQWALAQRRKEVISEIDETQNTDRQVMNCSRLRCITTRGVPLDCPVPPNALNVCAFASRPRHLCRNPPHQCPAGSDDCPGHPEDLPHESARKKICAYYRCVHKRLHRSPLSAWQVN